MSDYETGTAGPLFEATAPPNTTPETVSEQEAAVLRVMAGGQLWTPCRVHRRLEEQGHRWVITSIRRAITNLTKRGELEKTDKKTTGLYGAPAHYWRRVK